MRTPPLNQLATAVFLSRADVGIGKFGCRLWAQKRPPLLQRSPSVAWYGAAPMTIGFVSARMSISHTSLGASLQLSCVASSDASANPRLNIGWKVWVKPV